MAYYGTGNSMTGYYGDPSFWGALKGAVVGYVTGGYAGAVAGAVQGSRGSGVAPAAGGVGMPGGAPAQQMGPPISLMRRAMPVAARVGRVVMGHPVLTAAAAAGTAGLVEHAMRGHPTGVSTGVAGSAGAGGRYYTDRWGRVRMRRRMNVCNPRALRRAIRRAHGFTKLAMRTIHLVHPKKRASFGGFRKRRRK